MPADWEKALTRAADELERAHAARDQAIIDADAARVPKTAIARAVRLHRVQVGRIIAAHAAGDE